MARFPIEVNDESYSSMIWTKFVEPLEMNAWTSTVLVEVVISTADHFWMPQFIGLIRAFVLTMKFRTD